MQKSETYMIFTSSSIILIVFFGFFHVPIIGLYDTEYVSSNSIKYVTNPNTTLLIQELKDVNDKLSNRVNSLENDKMSLQSQVKKLQTNPSNIQQTTSNDGELQSKISSLERDLRLKDDEILKLQKEVSQVNANPNTTGDQTDLDKIIKKKTYEISQLKKGIDDLNRDLISAQSGDAQVDDKRVKNLKSEIENYKKKVQDADAKVIKSEQELVKIEKINTKLEREIVGLEKEIEDLKS